MRRLLFLIFVLCTQLAYGQKLMIEVYNEDNGKPIDYAYVNVYLDSGATIPVYTARTGEDGKATLESIPVPCRIEAAAIGYEPQSVRLTDINQPLSFQLTKKFATLKDVVVTGVPQPIKSQNALSTYKVITSETILAQGANNLADVMNNQLNMSVSNDNILGSGIRMQGMGGDKVKILIDGMPVNGREGGNIDMGQLNLYNVDHIEIVQGPMSVIYGSDALGGVINLITRDHFKKREFVGNAFYESTGKYNFNAFGSHKLGKRHNLSLGGGRNFFEGWKYIDTITPHRQMLFKPKEQYLGNLYYSYNAPSGFRIRFASDFLDEKVTNKGIANISSFEGYAIDEYYKTRRSLNRLTLQNKIGKEGFWQSNNSYALYIHTRNVYQKNLVTLEQELSPSMGSQDTSTFSETTSRSTFSNKWKKLNYSVGYDIDLQHAKSDRVSGGKKDIGDYAAIAIVSLPLFKEKITVQGGIRGAYNTLYSAPVTPSFNALIKPNDRWQIRASYAKGFRAPTLKELYLEFIDQNHHIIGNPDLKAEYAHHVQASASFEAYHKQADYLQFIITGYYNDVRNGIVLINQDPLNANSIDYSYGNLTRERNVIGNFQAETQYRGLHVLAGYSYNHTPAQEGSYDAFSYSEANLTVQYYIKKLKLNANVFYKFTGEQPFLMTGIDGTASYSGTQQSYHTMDASLERKFFKRRLQLVCGMKNILNVQTLSGTTSGGTHTGSGTTSFLPRSFFTTLRISLD